MKAGRHGIGTLRNSDRRGLPRFSVQLLLRPQTQEQQDQEKALEAKEKKEQETDFQRIRTTKAIKALTLDQKRDLAHRFIQEVGTDQAKSLDEEKAEFSNSIERVRFTAWLRQQLAPAFDKKAFAAWLKAKENK